MANATDRFADAVKGRFPTASGISSARFWTPMDLTGVETVNRGRQLPPGEEPAPEPAVGEGVPRPDRSMTTLKWLSVLPFTGILGLDHFYLRSPTTGLAKLLTLGGLGVWYLWDVLQVGLEGDRILNFGMSLPFDLKMGIGQGMMTNQPTTYTQQTSFAAWAFATVFGFLGVDLMMMGQLWKGVLKLLYFLIFIGVLVPFILEVKDSGLSSAIQGVSIMRIFLAIVVGMSALGVLIIWINNLLYLFVDPQYMQAEGLPISSQAQQLMSMWERLYKNDIYCDYNDTTKVYEFKSDEDSVRAAREYDDLRKQLRFTLDGITGEEFRRRFWVSHGRDDVIPEGGASGENVPVGSPLFTVMFRGFQNLWIIVSRAVKSAVKAIMCFFNPLACGVQELEARGAAALAGAGGAALTGLMQTATGLQQAAAAPVAAFQQAAPAAALRGLQQAAAAPAAALQGLQQAALPLQGGGARPEPVSTEVKIAGAVIAALAAAGGLKGIVDYLVE